MADQQQQQDQPLYSTLDAMLAEDAKRKAYLQNKPKASESSIPSKVVAPTNHEDDGVSLLSMPTSLLQQQYNTTHDQKRYPSQQSGGQSSQAHRQQQATGESSHAIEVKLKGGTTDDGTITSPITPKRATSGGEAADKQGLPALEVIPTTTTTATNVRPQPSSNDAKGHQRHPSANYFDDGDSLLQIPNRSQKSLQQAAVTPNQPSDMMEPYIPPPETTTNTAGNKQYIHTTYIRDPANFAANEEPLGPIDDLRIPLGLSSAPPSPAENQSPQNTGMGLNYTNPSGNNRQTQGSAWRRYIILVIAVLAIAAIAFDFVILVQGGSSDAIPTSPPVTRFVPPDPTNSPTGRFPTSAPSQTPTEEIVYDPPTTEDCERVLSGRDVPGQVNMIERLYEIPFDIVIKEGTELIGFLNQFLDGLRTIVIPELTRCHLQQRKLASLRQQSRRELRDISYVVANGRVTGDYSDEPCSRVNEGEFCQRIVVNFVLYLKGDERNLDIAVLIRNAIAGTDGSNGDASLLARFDLESKANNIQATEVINLNPTESPSVSPTNVPSVSPSVSPSNVPSMRPSASPSASPTTSMPSARPSASPSMAPSASPSCSETASWFDTEITSSPLRSGGLVTYSLNCADREAGIAVLVWDGVDKCSTTCLGYLNQADSESACTTSNQFIVSFNIPAAQDTASANFLVGTMDPVTAGSFSLTCPGSILASQSPSSNPSAGPTNLPSIEPSMLPSQLPSMEPSMVPSFAPSLRPSFVPSMAPSKEPTKSPSEQPSARPSESPSDSPSARPTIADSGNPTGFPSSAPSARPSTSPSISPTIRASASPSSKPSRAPSASPSKTPTSSPSSKPSRAPSASPSKTPTSSPSHSPTLEASGLPTSQPSKNPTSGPTKMPSSAPSNRPTRAPTSGPTSGPTTAPNPAPTAAPVTPSPTSGPTSGPTVSPSSSPSTSSRPSLTP